MNVLGKQAVVVGAGIAGLAAAQVLADFFESVVVLERDDNPFEAAPRPGVPQGRQPHMLMAGGLAALSGLFPGLEKELRAEGAIPLDFARDVRTELPGIGVLPKRDFDIASFAMTRPLLEHVLGRRVARRDNVVLHTGSRAVEIYAGAGRARVAGIQFERPNGAMQGLDADLVVDASGRAALTMNFLEACDCVLPRQSYVGVDLGYSTGVFSIPEAAALDFDAMMTAPAAPESSRGGYMLRVGETLWQVLLVGRGEDCPPADLDAFRHFAWTLPTPTIGRALAQAEFRGEIARFRFAGSIRRHFSEVSGLPGGLLPIGDALCRLNPVYGQGMTMAALEARLLQEVLMQHALTVGRASDLAGCFLGRVEPLIGTAWNVSTIPDFAYPQTTGDRPPDLEQKLQMQVEMCRKAVSDPDTHRAMLGQQHLLDVEERVPVRESVPA